MIRANLYLRRPFHISDAEVGITVEQMVELRPDVPARLCPEALSRHPRN
jgi:hypothetical protein